MNASVKSSFEVTESVKVTTESLATAIASLAVATASSAAAIASYTSAMRPSTVSSVTPKPKSKFDPSSYVCYSSVSFT